MKNEEFSVRKFMNSEEPEDNKKPEILPPDSKENISRNSAAASTQSSLNQTPEALDKFIKILKDPKISFMFKGIKKRIIYILLIIVAFSSVGFYYAKYQSDYLYKATAYMIKRKKQEKITGTMEDSAFQDYSLTTLLNTVKLRKNLEYVKSKLNLNIANEILGSMITLEKDRDSDILKISIVSKKPKDASEIANSLADAFVLNTLDIQKNLMEESFVYYQSQIDKTQGMLKNKENELAEFNKKHGITELETWTSALLKEMTEVDVLAETSRIESDGTDLRLNSLEAQIQKYPEQTVISSSVKDPLMERKSELMFEMNTLLSKYEPTNPKITKLNEQIEHVSEQIKKGDYAKNTEDTMGFNPTVKSLETEKALMESSREVLSKKTEALMEVRSQIQLKLLNLTEIQREYFDLKRQVGFTEELLKTLKNRLEDIKIVMEGQISDFKVLEYSSLPKYPTNPLVKKITLIFFFLLGTFLGLFSAILMEFIKTDPLQIMKKFREI